MSKTQPFAFVPRYGSFAGNGTFYLEPIPVTGFETVELFAWRGAMPTGGSFDIYLEESLDQQNWSALVGGDPGASTEKTWAANLSKTWLRAKIVLGTTADYPVATCYAVGFLTRRRG